MLKKFTAACVSIVNKYLPDPFLFALVLTLVVFAAGIILTGQTPLQMIMHWGGDKGVWGLLEFSMQMTVILVMGSAMASAKLFKQFLGIIAGRAKTPRAGVMLTVIVSSICCWFNWGFGLVVGALFAREIARRVKGVDYRLLVASAYGGYVIWHGGLSGSIPLSIATDGVLSKMSGGVFNSVIPMSETVFHPVNLGIMLSIMVMLPFLCAAMMPDKDKVVEVDPEVIKEPPEKVYMISTPAEKLEHSRILWGIIVVMGFTYIVNYFYINGFKLNLNIINFIFMFLGLLLHGNLRRYIDAIGASAKSAAGIILQFPFYAGIMGMMKGQNAEGISLAMIISNFFVGISNKNTFPVLTFLCAGFNNMFVPSGGGQWAVLGPVIMPAAHSLGVNPAQAAMGISWGDCWTNMIQPFWALPVLAVAGLTARDIMGYCVVVLLASGIFMAAGLILWPMLY